LEKSLDLLSPEPDHLWLQGKLIMSHWLEAGMRFYDGHSCVGCKENRPDPLRDVKRHSRESGNPEEKDWIPANLFVELPPQFSTLGTLAHFRHFLFKLDLTFFLNLVVSALKA
jgi:hypothetical protein